MKPLIKRSLNEEATETGALYWDLPRKFIDELGIDLYDTNDFANIYEIHFDTRNILISYGKFWY